MEKVKLSINDKLNVLWQDEQEIYKTTIQDMRGDFISISIPVNNGEYLTTRENQELYILRYDDNGDVYKFRCMIIKRTIDNNIPLYVLSKPYDIIKIQRRNYVRVKIIQLIKYLKIEDENSALKEDFFQKAILLDLSGGGMRIKVKEKCGLGESIAVSLKYNEINILVSGEIVRIETTDDNKFICGINFNNLDNVTREKIIKMVFHIMRRQRELT
ncbi:c-di-GMP-binding flagellar brake protein YcgR, contains PilZNR and PilZ domains [Clostridium cavendishii DSM 21758]|uniref:C-di-GMP-binding flagellar brake protein YcgR, contains PilZNR and PilZ domains n=1 Tax=Clostridium cavendishii DSM 21758 TaxID=1121302 RepID=A0A1M6AT38_9CLOT|nr:flagellar brake domain-containing protein [Clostridium cavendishii]SHI39597.1 c-di-GMP-binding flagellar brake protein YcgR, contains PilZNR and PilZ domains [Clostridium cavendishii DSM 21758]